MAALPSRMIWTRKRGHEFRVPARGRRGSARRRQAWAGGATGRAKKSATSAAAGPVES